MDRSHKVDISGLLAGGRRLIEVDDEVPIEPFEGIGFPDSARVHLELLYANRLLEIEGRVEVRAHGECGRCLEPVDRMIRVEVGERLDPFIGRDADPFGEGNVLTGGRVDVADLAQQNVLSALPMGLLCSEECAGLCSLCGANRNAGECRCVRS
jgi:uncharacterized protein